ncbi:MAG TPA: translation elongation factor Ts [Halanaerobiales bacterium]|nr:translation elongation factor Ts [Halanaerobiales bacterium]
MSKSMKDIKELRERTGAGVLDCKKALDETDGDIEAAIDFLREKGMSEAAKKSGRVAAEGIVDVLINEKRDKGIIVEVNSETDFVAKNERFQDLVSSISEHIMLSNAENLEQLNAEKWFKDESKTVETIIKEAIAGIGENINLRRYEKIETDGFLYGYIHLNGKIGVLAEFEGEKTEEALNTAKNISMHIAASNPEFLSREDVDEEVVEKEKAIIKEQLKNEGKPDHILDQIVEGKINKFYTQICLLEQEYIRDTDLQVQDVLDESDVAVKQFVRYELGEGIEKKQEDFAEEVMAEVNKNE